MSKLVKASFFLLLSELAFTLSGYAIHALLGRYLGPAEYGRYSLIVTFATMIIVLIGSGIPTAMSKYLSEVIHTDETLIPVIKKTGAKLQFILISIVTCLYFLAAPLFSRILHDPTLTPLFQVSALIIPAFASASFYFSYYTGIHHFQKQALLKFTRSIVKIIFIVGLGYYFKSMGAIIGQALAPLTVFIDAYLIDPYRKTPPVGHSVASKQCLEFHWKKLLQFAWPVTLFMIFYELMISIDLYIVKAILRNDTETGIYNAALTVGRIPYYAFYFLSIMLLPKISQTTSQGLKKETKQTLRISMRFLLMFLTPTVALLAGFSDSAVRFFFGGQYTAAGEPMSILVIGVGFMTIFYILAFVLNGSSNHKVPMWIAFAGAIINAGLNILLIKKYGLNGSALATSITAFFAMIAAIYYTSKKLCPFIKFYDLFTYLVASLIIFLIASNLIAQGRYLFIFWSFALLVFYLTILFFLKTIRRQDIAILLKLFKKKQTPKSTAPE
jgi:stage V sporulation protein B